MSLDLDTQTLRSMMATFGEAKAAKLDFLYAARCGRQVGVNRTHCRPLHPHGKRLIDAGLLRLTTSGSRTSNHSAVVITQKGLEELDRLLKDVAKRLRKDGGQRESVQYLLPGQKVFTRGKANGPEAKARRAKAIALAKAKKSA